jgi:hypothetical protein
MFVGRLISEIVVQTSTQLSNQQNLSRIEYLGVWQGVEYWERAQINGFDSVYVCGRNSEIV